MRKYEESILQNYQGFLQQLATIVQENVPTSGSSSKASANPRFGLLHVAMRCFCELMQKCSHFNFRVNIMSAVVSRMNLRLPEGYAEAAGMEPDCIARMCCSTIESMFREDEHGENSLDTVKLIAKLVKARDYNVQPMVLDTFLALRLVESSSSMNAGARGGDEGDNPKQRKADKQHVSKRQKKKVKVDVEIEQELKEAEAVVDKEEQQKLVG